MSGREMPTSEGEMTPEMIEAADSELVVYDGEEQSPRGRAEVLKRVFRAMLAAQASSRELFPVRERHSPESAAE